MQLKNFVHYLNTSFRWSNLSKFGTSPYGRLTVLAPVVGFLVFRNDALNGYLQLVEDGSRLSWHQHLSSLRLELFYLGLVLIGVSVGLYSIFVPQQIRDHALYSKFLKVKIDTSTPEALQFSFDKTIGPFSSRMAGSRNFGQLRSVVLPLHYDDGYQKLLIRIYTAQVRKSDPSKTEEDAGPELGEFSARLKSRQLSRADIALLRKNLSDFGSDVYRFEYIFAEYLGFGRRFFVFSMFGLGVLITLLPTFLTTTSILSKIIFGSPVG